MGGEPHYERHGSRFQAALRWHSQSYVEERQRRRWGRAAVTHKRVRSYQISRWAQGGCGLIRRQNSSPMLQHRRRRPSWSEPARPLSAAAPPFPIRLLKPGYLFILKSWETAGSAALHERRRYVVSSRDAFSVSCAVLALTLGHTMGCDSRLDPVGGGAAMDLPTPQDPVTALAGRPLTVMTRNLFLGGMSSPSSMRISMILSP